MKTLLLLTVLLASFTIPLKVSSQTSTVKSAFTDKKCDELIRRVSDSIMNITGDMSKNFLKINEMTNRVTYQFVTEFAKNFGKPVSGEDFKYLLKKSNECVNGSSQVDKLHKECKSCLGLGYRICDYCHGRARELCKTCKGTGNIELQNSRYSCTKCGGRGELLCRYCNGSGNLKCVVCNGSGYLK